MEADDVDLDHDADENVDDDVDDGVDDDVDVDGVYRAAFTDSPVDEYSASTMTNHMRHPRFRRSDATGDGHGAHNGGAGAGEMNN